MNVTIEKKREEAISRMRAMKVFPKAVQAFARSKKVMYCLPPFGGLYELDDEMKEIAKRFEQETNSLVYLVLRNSTEDGVMDSFLYVSDHEEEWEYDRADLKDGYVYAYVYNHDVPYFSEIGSIGIVSRGGGVLRVA